MAEIDGERAYRDRIQLCTTAPGVDEFFARHLGAAFDARPDIQALAVTQADGT